MFKSNNKGIETLSQFRIPLYNKNLPIILFWSQKSGCTSLTKWFFFQIGLLQEALEYNPFIHIYRGQVYCSSINYKDEMKKAILSSKKDIIKLVRNPYTRAVSSFLHVLKSGTPNDKDNSKFHQELEKVFERNNCRGMSFKQFLYSIEKVGSDLTSIDRHIAQQYIDGEELWVKQYIYLEDFKKYISSIENKYNLSTSPIDALVQSHHHKSSLIKKKRIIRKVIQKKLYLRIYFLRGIYQTMRVFMIKKHLIYVQNCLNRT